MSMVAPKASQMQAEQRILSPGFFFPWSRTRKEEMGLQLEGDAERKGGVDAIGEAPSVSISLAWCPRSSEPGEASRSLPL